MTAARKRVHAIATEMFGDVACTDHGCVFGHPGGMGTNGGCQHFKERDLTAMRRTMAQLAAIVKRLAAENLR